MALSKIADLRPLSDTEIAEQVLALKKQLFDLRFQQATRQEVKSHQYKHIRHQLAQLLTLERERQIAAQNTNTQKTNQVAKGATKE
jgi:large subunit ribosomal protein L29